MSVNRNGLQTSAGRHAVAMLLVMATWLACGEAGAYERPGQLEVLTPPRSAVPVAAPTGAEFSSQYAAVGRPRIALFWDVAFDQHTEMQAGGLEYSTATTLGEGSISTSERLGAAARVDPSEQNSGMSAGTTAAVESSFVAALVEAGVGLVDRGTVMRSRQAQAARDETNRKLIETDAILQYADLLLEVLPTSDPSAPLGYGFRVSCRELATGMSLLGFYFDDELPAKQAPGRYVATDRGFEWYQPAAEPAEPGEYGRALAQVVLAELGSRLGDR